MSGVDLDVRERLARFDRDYNAMLKLQGIYMLDLQPTAELEGRASFAYHVVDALISKLGLQSPQVIYYTQLNLYRVMESLDNPNIVFEVFKQTEDRLLVYLNREIHEPEIIYELQQEMGVF